MRNDLSTRLTGTTQNWQTPPLYSPDNFTVANFNPLLPLTKIGSSHVHHHMYSAVDLCLSPIIPCLLQRRFISWLHSHFITAVFCQCHKSINIFVCSKHPFITHAISFAKMIVPGELKCLYLLWSLFTPFIYQKKQQLLLWSGSTAPLNSTIPILGQTMVSYGFLCYWNNSKQLGTSAWQHVEIQ
jgi:hypothetical protein